jgi:hypothetical protein
MLKNKMETVDQVPQDPVKDVWEYVEDLVQKIMLQHSENFIQVQSSCRRAIQNLMEKTVRAAQHVKELIEMELGVTIRRTPTT